MSLNTTPNIKLPQWTSDEKPSFLVEMNGAFSSIDTSYGLLKGDIESIKTEQTGLTQKIEDAVSKAEAATNTANSAVDTASHAATDAQNAQSDATAAQDTANTALNNSQTAINTSNTALNFSKFFTPIDIKSKITFGALPPQFSSIECVYAVLSGNFLNLDISITLTKATEIPTYSITTNIALPTLQKIGAGVVNTNNTTLSMAINTDGTLTGLTATAQYGGTVIHYNGVIIVTDDFAKSMRNQS